MSKNKVNPYNLDEHIAELYDRQEDYTDDVQLLLDLLDVQGPLDIFEPFCGTGRILVPLVKAGHRLTGLDQSDVLLKHCKSKLRLNNGEATLIEGDALANPWPTGFDLVILGGNCLYELASSEEQESCIRQAALALKPGGYIFLDNDHMEGNLAAEWQDLRPKSCFPSGVCADGVRLESTRQITWFEVEARLANFRRITKVIYADGRTAEHTYFQQKHPVSTGEVKLWLDRYGLSILRLMGSRSGKPYEDTSPRAIFWGQKRIQQRGEILSK